MPATHLSLYYHLIFSTKNRYPWIKAAWMNRLYGYIGGIIRRLGGVMESIGGTEDHLHILASLPATHSIAEILKEIKACSSGWVHSGIGEDLFGWHAGYAAFTVSRSDIDAVRKYIEGQKEHHRKRPFQEELRELLRENGIEYNEKYLW